MYGRIFESMFEGSMVGAGAGTFAVWSYVIAKMRADAVVGAQVDLNPTILATVLGESQKDVEAVIRKLCAPDPGSRTPDEDGRRLIKLGTFSYQVVNGAKYLAIQNAEQKREADRNRKRKSRAKQNVPRGTPLPGEQAYERAVNRGEDGKRELEVIERSMSISGASNEAVKVDTMDGSKLPPGAKVKSVTTSTPSAEQAAKGVIGYTETVYEVPGAPQENQPIPEISSGPVYPVQEDDPGRAPEGAVESGKFVDGEWVPD